MRKKWTAAACALLMGMLWAVSALGTEGSWSQINQPITRPEGWRQIVEESPFALGETVEAVEVDGAAFPILSYGTYPCMDGSTVAVPMAMEFARQHLGLDEEELGGFVFFSTTHHAYTHLIEETAGGGRLLPGRAASMDPGQPVNLVLATHPSREELAMAEAAGAALRLEPVCHDAFVFITHADNPIESLDADQIRAIYQGDITNWREVGGEDAPIMAYQREPNSGSQTAMEELVMQGAPMDAAQPNYVTGSMEGLVRRVGDYENSRSSLGYTYRYYIDNLFKGEPIKTIAVNGIAPTDENLRSGAYPFATRYYGVIREADADGPAGQFLDWMRTDEGQACIRQAGYVPLEGAQRDGK